MVSGDTTQSALPHRSQSGLLHGCEVLKDIEDISFLFFSSKDVVRHPLVAQIVDAYDAHVQDDDE